MKTRFLNAAVAAAAIALPAIAADVTLKPDGSVRIGGSELKPIVPLAGWRGAKLCGGYELGKDNVARFRAEDRGKKVLDATVSLSEIGNGAVRIDYAFAATASFKTESVGCVLLLPIDKVEGSEIGRAHV